MRNLILLLITAAIFNTCKPQPIKIAIPKKILIEDEFPLNYPNLEVHCYSQIGLLEICFAKLEVCRQITHTLKICDHHFLSQPITNWKHGNLCLCFKIRNSVNFRNSINESRVVVRRWEKRY